MTSLAGGHISLLPSAPWGAALGLNEPLPITLLDLNPLAEISPPQLIEVLSVTEQERYQGFRYPKRQQEWLGGRIAAKAAVQELLARLGFASPAATALVIASDHNGKPRIAFTGLPRTVHISISHSHGQAVAMASLRPCGIDLQYFTPTTARVREKFATTAEEKILAATLGKQPEITRLTLLWSAKEAIRKIAPITPLPPFQAMTLSAVQPAGAEYLFLFSAPEICHNAHLRVVATVLDDYALAASLLPTRE